MRNILYIGAFELPDKNAAAHRVINNAKCFNELGVHTIFLDMQKGKIESEHELLYNEIEVYHRKYPNTIFQYFVYAFSIKKFKEIIKIHNDIDTVIVYNIFSLTFLRILLYCKSHKIRIISDCTEWYSSSILNIVKRVDILLRMHLLNKFCDGIIVISSYLKSFYQNLKTVKIPPLIDNSEDKWSKRNKCKENTEIIFSYCGIPGKKERLDLFINVLSSDGFKNYNFRFNIVGITEVNFKGLYPNVIDLYFGDKIFFYGLVSHDKALEIMKNSNFGIILREKTRTNNAGFPTKFVEYSSLGVPVIISCFSDVEDYITDTDILINEVDFKQITEALQNIFSNKMIKQKKDSNLFNYKNFTKNFKVFFDEIEN